MSKHVTLTPTTIVSYGGRRYGVGMQFDCDPDDAKDFLKSKQCIEANAKVVKVASPVEYTAPANDLVAAKQTPAAPTK